MTRRGGLWLGSCAPLLLIVMMMMLATVPSAYVVPQIHFLALFESEPSNVSSTDSTPNTPTTEPTDSSTNQTTDPPTTPSTDPPTTPSTVPPTTNPPIQGEELFRETSLALSSISLTLDAFLELVEEAPTPGPRPGRGNQKHPVARWTRSRKGARKTSSELSGIESICDLDNELCQSLVEVLTAIDRMVGTLIDQTDAWNETNLRELQGAQRDLHSYFFSAVNNDDFLYSVNRDAFIDTVGAINQKVVDGKEVADDKEESFTDPPSSTHSVVLVAVLGSVGGLFILSLLCVTICIGMKSAKTKKASALKHGTRDFKKNTSPGGLASDIRASKPSRRSQEYPPSRREDLYARPQPPVTDNYYSSSPSKREDLHARPHPPVTDSYYSSVDVYKKPNSKPYGRANY